MRPIPAPFLTDSYKWTHPPLYSSDVDSITAAFCARGPLAENDHRIVVGGVRYFKEEILPMLRLDRKGVDEGYEFSKYFIANKGVYPELTHPYPKELFDHVIKEYDGFLPIELEVIPDGHVVYPTVPILQATMKKVYAPLTTLFEPMWTNTLWPAITTGTKTAHMKEDIKAEYDITVDAEDFWFLDYSVHDFGLRGASGLEAAVIGGVPHLMSSNGTDNLPAAYYATKYFNGGEPLGSNLELLIIGTSVTATEHCVTTSWGSRAGVAHSPVVGELAFVKHVLNTLPKNSIVSIVADTYGYQYFIDTIIPAVKQIVIDKNITFVLRPDSGVPVEVMVKGSKALESTFGMHYNRKGFKVLHHSRTIQGDGIKWHSPKELLKANRLAGYAANNYIFGTGGGLLQDQTRDTLKIASKGNEQEVGDQIIPMRKMTPGKTSIGGKLTAGYYSDGNHLYIKAFSAYEDLSDVKRVLVNINDLHYPSTGWFTDLRQMLAQNWKNSPKIVNPISPYLMERM